MTTREAGRLGATDAEQLELAASLSRAILTHNRADFERLAMAYMDEGRHHAGILIAGRRPAMEVARRLLLLLDRMTADEARDQLRYL